MAFNNTITGDASIGDSSIEGSVSFGNQNIGAPVIIGNTIVYSLSLPSYTEGEEDKQPDEKSNGQEDGYILANPLSLSFYTEGEEDKQPDEISNGQEDGHIVANPHSLSANSPSLSSCTSEGEEELDKFYTAEREFGEEDEQPDEISNGQGKLNQGDGRTIGKVFVSNREIGKGSNGTIVLEGTYEGRRPVAVKRLVKAFQDVADKEYQNLCLSDRHSNIVRLYGVERDQDFVYLALERCTCSLNDLIQMQLLDAPTTSGDQATEVNIEYKVRLQSMKGTLRPEVKLWKDSGDPSPTLWRLMRDMVFGLVHLHEFGMIHRDLKPQNVLIVQDKKGSLCAKLADMGISKLLAGDKSSLGNHATTGCGTSGWQAPELLLHGRQMRAIDVFSLGCVLFYCISGGKHPFGDPLVRDVNIVKGKVKLFLVNHIPEAVDLLDHLLDPKAELRPKASEVLTHPMFWDSDKRLSFLHDASDRLQQKDPRYAILKELEDKAPRDRLQQKDSRYAILKELEDKAPRVLGIIPGSERGKSMELLQWDKKIDTKLLNDNYKARCYSYDCVHDLLRFIRNKKNHFSELPREIQEILRLGPGGFDGYFRSRFPKLLMEVYKVLHKYCREEESFNKYFKGSVDCAV